MVQRFWWRPSERITTGSIYLAVRSARCWSNAANTFATSFTQGTMAVGVIVLRYTSIDNLFPSSQFIGRATCASTQIAGSPRLMKLHTKVVSFAAQQNASYKRPNHSCRLSLWRTACHFLQLSNHLNLVNFLYDSAGQPITSSRTLWTTHTHLRICAADDLRNRWREYWEFGSDQGNSTYLCIQ